VRLSTSRWCIDDQDEMVEWRLYSGLFGRQNVKFDPVFAH
jgi:hypothetical protein